jgi:hypothetical protein
MRDLIDIIADYQESDSANRLNLFLQYPRLRSTFVRIDQSEQPPLGRGNTQPGRIMASIRRGCRVLASFF